MVLSPALQEAIERGLAGVRTSPQHHLELHFRQAIWAALGQRMDTHMLGGGPGHYRRTMLDVMTVRHILPLWTALWPDDDAPTQTLKLAQDILAGSITDENRIRDESALTWGYIKNLTTQYGSEHAFEQNVLVAATKAVDRAWYDQDFDPDSIDPAAEDGFKDPYDTDAAFDASVAVARGVPWLPSSDPARRLAFWEWWLTEAVPAAWASVPEAQP